MVEIRTLARQLIRSLLGTARYTGPAAGKYAYRERGKDEAYKGVFTAKADLMADFDANTIGGTVSEFGGEHNLGDWHVVLGQVMIAGENLLEAGINGCPNWTIPMVSTRLTVRVERMAACLTMVAGKASSSETKAPAP